MSENNNIYKYLQTKTISSILLKTDMSFFRKVCRWFSKNYSIPLDEVMECKRVQWDEILLHYYEEYMEDAPYNSIFDTACRDFIPELAKELEEEDQKFADALVEEQKRTIAAKKERDRKKKEKKKIDKKQKVSVKDNKEEKKKTPEIKEMNLKFDDDDSL